MSPGRRVRMPDVVRRRRTPRFDLTTVLAVLLPLVTIGLLALVHQSHVTTHAEPPSLTRLTRSLVVCPSASGSATTGAVSTASGTSGHLTVGSGTSNATVQVRTPRTTPVHIAGAFVAQGADALAPGVLGLRSGTSPVTGLDCPVPAPDQWFTGIGARADHDSILQLVNPDTGPAIADITLFGTHEFDAQRLHGVRISGHTTVSLDLGKLVPKRPLMSANVQVTRGRLAVHVLDTVTNLATKKVQREWMPRQLAPAADLEMLGLPPGAGTRNLAVANPGTDVVRVQVEIVTGDTSFVPKGLKPLIVDPGATTRLSLSHVLGSAALKDGAIGLALHADGPVTASLVTGLATDRVITVPSDLVHQEAATLLPVASPHAARASQVSATVYLSADTAGSARVTAYDASGKRLLRRTAALQQGRTVSVRLPEGASYLQVTPSKTPIRGAVLVTGNGATVIPLHELLTRGLVPQISPGRD
jgi:hypothetical protein